MMELHASDLSFPRVAISCIKPRLADVLHTVFIGLEHLRALLLLLDPNFIDLARNLARDLIALFTGWGVTSSAPGGG
jgi:hypothetical protein